MVFIAKLQNFVIKSTTYKKAKDSKKPLISRYQHAQNAKMPKCNNKKGHIAQNGKTLNSKIHTILKFANGKRKIS